MSDPTPPAVSDAMRDAVARDVAEWTAITPGRRVRSLGEWLSRPAGPIASEITRLTGEWDAAAVAMKFARHEETLERRRAEAAEAETARLRAALKLAENPLSYRHATDPNGPGSIAVARALEAVRAALTSQEKTDV